MNEIAAACLNFALMFTSDASAAIPEGVRDYSTEIVSKKDATHIAGIKGDTVKVIGGSTFVYTVDTPEGEGRVSTSPDVTTLLQQISSKDGSKQQHSITNDAGLEKKSGKIVSGDYLNVTSHNGKSRAVYILKVVPGAVGGRLKLLRDEMTIRTPGSLTLLFTAGQRSPNTAVTIFIPPGVTVTMNNTTVNVIGRGEVTLKDLDKQSIGRVGTHYSYSKVGSVTLEKSADGGTIINFTNLDLRPANGTDLVIRIADVNLDTEGKYSFKAFYTTSEPEILTSPGVGGETTTLTAVRTISDFERVLHKGRFEENTDAYDQVTFRWRTGEKTSDIYLMQSLDDGKTWKTSSAILDAVNNTAILSELEPNKRYTFKLSVKKGLHKGFSNLAYFHAGKIDIKNFGVTGEGREDDTEKINEAIEFVHKLGGGVLLLSSGEYSVKTVHLKSNVHLFVSKGATIKALKGGDAPEKTWFSDKKYRSGLSPTDTGPYNDPENYLTKQDVGHTFFRNTMFFGERLDNVKIVGNGLITGDGNLVTGDKVMNNLPDKRSDKMFTFKLCTNVEIGGLYREEDLWYDPAKDEPYYRDSDSSKDFDVDNMLKIEQAGHFVLLATGTDTIHVHDTYFGKNNTSNSRDIYDFMSCNAVTVTNIYCKVTSDDIVKPGSDCSLGFTRPARDYRVRNIIGDTNCNLFQIGSETADDIMDVHVDNIYVLGANKAGFSISTNDGGHIKDIHLNCGHTGKLHSRSKVLRSFAPFFISISNRGRILGADVGMYEFSENGEPRKELLVKNVNIGRVENIFLNSIDVSESYAGSAFRSDRWKPYDGSQRRATAIIAGYGLPDNDKVNGGLDFKLPNEEHIGYIKNVVFNDVNILVKGGNPLSDTLQHPPELGVGQYNVSNLKTQPSYGIWARHVEGLTLKNCTFEYEIEDSRYAIFLNDVLSPRINSVKVLRSKKINHVLVLENAPGAVIDNFTFYDQLGEAVTLHHLADSTSDGNLRLPGKSRQ